MCIIKTQKMSVVLLSGRFKMSVVLLSGRFKMSVSLLSGKKIAADKRLFSKEKNEVTGRRFEMYQTDSVRNRAKLYEVHA